jgi:hypothetical protein
MLRMATGWPLAHRMRKSVHTTFSSQGGYLFFRACVTLRRILAARRRPLVRRVRKAAAVAVIWCTTLAGVNAGDGHEAAAIESHESARLYDDDIRPIRELGASIAQPAGELPTDAAQQRFAQAPVFEGAIDGRDWLGYAYFWKASSLAYHPLYFEERMVERYGYNAGCILQPIISSAHFFSAIPALPMKMVLDRPCTCVYPLGFARPGSVVDCVR